MIIVINLYFKITNNTNKDRKTNWRQWRLVVG